MTGTILASEEIAILEVLTYGIIPADDRDAGAASVNAAMKIAERARQGTIGPLYREGLALAARLAHQTYGRDVTSLSREEIHELIPAVAEQMPTFFRQLRVDTCGLYISNADVWKRIGFPGPSSATGGYPAFDRPRSSSREPLGG